MHIQICILCGPYCKTSKPIRGYAEAPMLAMDENVPKTITNFELTRHVNLLEVEKRIFQPALYTITCLNLSYCGLSGLPKTLIFLQLRNLNLSNNKLVSVPQCLYNLDALESLDLSYNSITQFDVGSNLNLKVLYLYDSILPHFLKFKCPSLEELNYSGNKVRHCNNNLQHDCNFSKAEFKKLELRNSCLVDSDILWLKCFNSLQFLDISNDDFLKGQSSYNINRFENLNNLFLEAIWNEMEILKLNYLNIPFFPEGIFCIESLTELHISNNLLSWFPDGIECLINLEYLDISFNELFMLPKEICKLVKLKVLIACANNVYDCPLTPANLKVLDLYDNNLKSLENINFDSIANIDLDYNYVYVRDENFSYAEYCLKRDQFRIRYNIKDRFDEPKQLEESENYSSYDFSDCEYNSSDKLLGDNDYVPYPSECYEDWDKEYESLKHPDITLSDDEYNGEYYARLKSKFNKTKKVIYYDDDEDWIYTDAD